MSLKERKGREVGGREVGERDRKGERGGEWEKEEERGDKEIDRAFLKTDRLFDTPTDRQTYYKRRAEIKIERRRDRQIISYKRQKNIKVARQIKRQA